MNDSSSVFEVIHKTLQTSNNALPVSQMCAAAGVSRSGYYAWVKAASTRALQEEQDKKDFDLILKAYNMRGYSKGARGIQMALLHMDTPVIMNLKKIRRLMRKFHLYCPVRGPNPYRRMARALRTSNVADNLLHREFEAYGPRMVLLTDITYLPYQGTFAYLSTILDAYTKQILAYVVSESLEVDFVIKTVEQLTEKHGASLYEQTILHSDQGCHYTSFKYIQVVRSKKLQQSMSRRGNCWDNAPQESFFGHMKDAIKDSLKAAKNIKEVQQIVDDYMDYYNNDRYQWQLAKLSPNEFYRFLETGVYPLDIPNAPPVPIPRKSPDELGRHP